MARIATIVLSVAVTLVVPAILAVNCIRMATDEEFVQTVYDYGWVPEDRYGFTEQERERLALLGLRSIEPSTEEGVGVLREARLANGEPAFGARELSHMQDVRTAVSRAYRFQIIALVAIGVLAVLFALLRTTRALDTRSARQRRSAHGDPRRRRRHPGAGELQHVRDDVPLAVLRGRYVALRGDGHAPPAVPRPLLARHGSRHRRRCVLQAVVLFFAARFWARRAGVRRPLRMQARTEGT